MNKRLPIFLFLLFFGLFVRKSVAAHTTQNKAPKTDSIAFLTFRMKAATDTSKATLALIIKRVRAGKLKKHSNLTQRNPQSLACILIRGDGKPSDTLWVDNPTNKEIEYVDESRTLQRKRVTAESADFFIRFQKSGFEKVSVQQPAEKGLWATLLSVNL